MMASAANETSWSVQQITRKQAEEAARRSDTVVSALTVVQPQAQAPRSAVVALAGVIVGGAWARDRPLTAAEM